MAVTKRIFTKLLALGVVVTLAAGSRDAAAEPVDAAGIIQQIDLYDVLLKYPQPAWISGLIEPSELLDRSAYFKQHDGPTYIIEQIPDGQSFERWGSLFAVVAEELEPSRAVPMQTFVGLSVETNRRACAEGGFGVQVLGSDDRSTIAVMVCDSVVDGPVELGYGAHVGEVSIWRFLVFENTYLKIYQRWRGPAFDIDVRGGWPVGEAEMQEMVRRITDQVEVLPNHLRR